MSSGLAMLFEIQVFLCFAEFSLSPLKGDVLIENFHDQVSGTQEGVLLMGTDGSPSDGEFEFKFTKCVITNAALSEGDVMAVDVSVKAVGAGIGSSDLLFEISC